MEYVEVNTDKLSDTDIINIIESVKPSDETFNISIDKCSIPELIETSKNK